MNIVDCSSTQYPVLDVIELMNPVSLLCIVTLHYHMFIIITTRFPEVVRAMLPAVCSISFP
jgi:hypothetical protein